MPRPNFGIPFTQTFRSEPYAAIDPTQLSLSAAGKTILITAGHTGIGFAIAKNFAIAGVANVILLARRAEVLEQAAKNLSTAHPKTKFHHFTASVDDALQIKEIFSKIKSRIFFHRSSCGKLSRQMSLETSTS